MSQAFQESLRQVIKPAVGHEEGHISGTGFKNQVFEQPNMGVEIGSGYAFFLEIFRQAIG